MNATDRANEARKMAERFASKIDAYNDRLNAGEFSTGFVLLTTSATLVVCAHGDILRFGNPGDANTYAHETKAQAQRAADRWNANVTDAALKVGVVTHRHAIERNIQALRNVIAMCESAVADADAEAAAEA